MTWALLRTMLRGVPERLPADPVAGMWLAMLIEMETGAMESGTGTGGSGTPAPGGKD